MKKINIVLIIFVLFAACKKNNDAAAPAAGRCKLKEIITTGRGELTTADPSTYTTTETMEYNEKNLQTGYYYQSTSAYAAGKTSNTSISRDFQYDADGFLIKQIYRVTGKDKAGKTSAVLNTQNYEYNKGLLIKTTLASTYTSNGIVTNETGTLLYEYTTDGKIAKYTNIHSGSPATNFEFFEYSNGKLSKISFTISGTLVTPLIEVSAKGFVTKLLTPSFEYRYQYDAEGNNIRQELWRNSTKDITIYELDAKQNVSSKILPVFKGQPDLSFYSGNENAYGFTHNMTTQKFLSVDISGVEKSLGYNTYTYQYNSNNLPSAGGRTYTNAAGKTDIQETLSYTYLDCAP